MAAKFQFIDMRDVIDDPVWAFVHGGGRPVLVVVPLERTRNLGPLAFPTSIESGDPYVASVRDYLTNVCLTYTGSWLEWFYAHWTPHNAAAVIGIPDKEASLPLVEASPFGFVYPWTSGDPRLIAVKHLGSIQSENAKKGQDIPGEEGHIAFGPVSKRKGELGFARLCRLADSIFNNGYQVAKSNINGQVMMRGNDWCITRGGGNHRRAVLAGFGWTHAPVRLKAILRREEVDYWPNVLSGLYTKDQALRIFDRIFEGRQPVGCPSIFEAEKFETSARASANRHSAGSATAQLGSE